MTRLGIGYVLYLIASLIITVWVGRALHRHGRPFLIDVFHGQTSLADTVNHLLLVGYYLLNIALVLLLLRTQTYLPDNVSIMAFLADKLGVVLTILGVMHFLNVAVLTAVREIAWSRPTEITTFLD